MTNKEFNEKYNAYLEQGHYGLDINYPTVVNYLDLVFEDLIRIPGFTYSQIKLKFSTCRFYTNVYEIVPIIGNIISLNIEKHINFLIEIENEILKRQINDI